MRSALRRASLAPRGRAKPIKFRVILGMRAVEGIPQGTNEVLVQCSRGNKLSISGKVPVVGERAYFSAVSGDLDFICTLYRNPSNSYDEKKFTLKLRTPKGRKRFAEEMETIASGDIDVAILVADGGMERGSRDVMHELQLKKPKGQSVQLRMSVKISIVSEAVGTASETPTIATVETYASTATSMSAGESDGGRLEHLGSATSDGELDSPLDDNLKERIKKGLRRRKSVDTASVEALVEGLRSEVKYLEEQLIQSKMQHALCEDKRLELYDRYRQECARSSKLRQALTELEVQYHEKTRPWFSRRK